jgi:flagellar FliL protein
MAQAAKAPPAKTEAPPAPEPPKRGGKVLLIVVLIVVILFLIAALLIGALVFLKKGSGGGNNHDAPAAEVVAPVPVQQLAPTVDLHKPPTFAPLEQFTVNLASGQDGDDSRYLQALIVLKVADAQTAEALKGWMPEIRHRINLLLSAKTPTEVQDTKGREGLATEIQIQINALLGVPPPQPGTESLVVGPIQAVLFNSFIIQ